MSAAGAMSRDRNDTYLLDRTGTLLGGRYRVLELIGAGAMGSVWLAEHLALRREVVVKFHESFRDSDGLGLRRFLREGRALSAVRHRNLVELYEVGHTDRGEPFLIMERLRGRTLADRLNRELKLPPVEAFDVAIGLASGLEAVHAAGILHRDVKPENVILHEEGDAIVPRLVDFGLARPVEGGERITTDNRAIGTPGYMAPEQVVGVARVDARVDVYALGAVLYEMLSGELPVEGQTAMQLMASTAEDDPIPLAAWCPEHRGPVDALLMAALARDRDERTSDARTLRLALEALRDDLPRGRSRAAPTLPGMSHAIVHPRERQPTQSDPRHRRHPSDD